MRHGSALAPVKIQGRTFATRLDFLKWADDECVSRVYRLGPAGGDVIVNELIHPVGGGAEDSSAASRGSIGDASGGLSRILSRPRR